MSIKNKEKEAEWAQAQKIAESADISANDQNAIKALSTLVTQKSALLEKIQPIAANYETVLADKLWAQIQKETPPKKSKVGSWFMIPRWAMGFAAVLALLGTFYFYTNTNTSLFDPGPLNVAFSDFVDAGATQDDLDSWLLTVGDSETRYELLAQNINSLERSVDSLKESKDKDRVLFELKEALGAKVDL